MSTQKTRVTIMYVLIVLVFLGFLAGVFLWRFFRTDIFLPDGTDAIIKEVLSEELPEFVIGETGYADAYGVKIWYEVLSETDTPKGTILLIRGYTRSALNWTPSFYEPLLAAGYRVIRFDNRDVGMSDWITDWQEETAYTLPDMAEDAIAVLDAAEVMQAHVVGISMGGGIAQEIAIRHPERVLTLTLINTSGYRNDPELADSSREFSQNLKRIALRYGFFSDVENQLRLRVAIEEAARGDADYVLDVKQAAQIALYEIRYRRGHNPAVADHHLTVIDKTTARYEGLRQLEIPTLVIHGSKDYISSRAGAEKLAETIPDAETLWIDGMGHDVVEPYDGMVVSRLLALIATTNEGTALGLMEDF